MNFKYEKLMKYIAAGEKKIKCDESMKDVKVESVLGGVYNETAAKELSVKDLVARGDIEKAIHIFEERHPKEGILLKTRFSSVKEDYLKGTLIQEKWHVEKQRIIESLLEFSDSSE